jgi:hypothetical protein
VRSVSRRLLCAVSLSAILLTGDHVFAQSLLTLPVQAARSLGMGATGVADNTDPSTVYWNPANAVAPPRAYLSGSRADWPDDWIDDDLWAGRASAGFAWWGSGDGSLRWGADFTLAKLDFGESIATLPDGTPLGTSSPFEKIASLALAVGIPSGERWEFRAGAAAKRWWAEYPAAEFTPDPEPVTLDAYAFDAGLTTVMHAVADGWGIHSALAVAVTDAGPDFEVEGEELPLPTRWSFGTSIHIESPARRIGNASVPLVALTANVDGTYPRNDDFEWGMGTEVGFAQILFVRTGAHIVHQDDGEDINISSWGVGLGVPVSSFRMRVDYAKRGYSNSLLTNLSYVGATLVWVL